MSADRLEWLVMTLVIFVLDVLLGLVARAAAAGYVDRVVDEAQARPSTLVP